MPKKTNSNNVNSFTRLGVGVAPEKREEHLHLGGRSRTFSTTMGFRPIQSMQRKKRGVTCIYHCFVKLKLGKV